MLAMIDGTRKRDRQKTHWIDTIKPDTDMNLNELKEIVKTGNDKS